MKKVKKNLPVQSEYFKYLFQKNLEMNEYVLKQDKQRHVAGI